MCHKVPWLDNLLRTKDIPTLGTTFCCRVQDTVKYIPEIPTCCNSGDEEQPTEPTFHVIREKPSFNEVEPFRFNALPEDSKDYVRALYENLGKHPFEYFLNQFSRRNSEPDQNHPNSFGTKSMDLDKKVQRDVSSLYGRPPVEVHSLPYQLPEGRFNY